MPNLPCEFEIPDGWIAESGIDGFTPRTPAFRSVEGSRSVPLTEIAPLARQNGYPKDWRGFEQPRLVRVLRGFVADEIIPAVPLIQLPDESHLVRLSYRFVVRDGYHRYYGSIVAGYSHLPATVDTLDELLDQAMELGVTTQRVTYSQ